MCTDLGVVMSLSSSDLTLLGEVFNNGQDEIVLPLFSKADPEELHEVYCDLLFKKYGSFHPIENPATKVFDRTEHFSMKAICGFCDVETNCTVHAATRTSKLFLICRPCMQDFNMHVFNPNNKDYCRSLKQKR